MGQKCAALWGFIGLVVLAVGIITPTIFNIILRQEMRKMLPLEVGSYSYEKWRDLPVPMQIQLWVFDVINADEVMDHGVKPYVVEKGPYTYRLKKQKENITFHANSTVTFRQLSWYYFDRELSVGDENDTFTTINNILLGAAYMTRFEYPVVKEITNLILEALGGNLYEKYTVWDMVWGYEDPLLKIIKDDILGAFNLSYTLDDHFGFFYKWNGSDEGQFTVYTGAEDLARLSKVDTFNGLTNAPFWSTPYARMLNGTDGTFFPPFLDKHKPLFFYSPNACRTLYMDFDRENIVKDIDTYRYLLPASMLESGSVNPDNVGFCTPNADYCMPSGVLNVSGCREASSAVMSYPHFLGGDPEVINGVNGLHPDPQHHASFLDLEPTSGVPMEVAMRLQIGVFVSNFSSIRQLKHTTTYFHPILWFNESTVITDDLAGQLRTELVEVVQAVSVLHYLLPCVGAVVVVIVVFYTLRRRKRQKKNTENRETETDSTENDPLLVT
ncbi:scavenger receptor class B member 1-like [Haliotis cracherodii]|uniref:scavenger receptor class B member 1-like n=1 Tax=Haliotis cracherodii TaxID=6455 RepID=UPI0039E92B3A